MIGRVVDPLGKVLGWQGSLKSNETRFYNRVESKHLELLRENLFIQPVQTGIKAMIAYCL